MAKRKTKTKPPAEIISPQAEANMRFYDEYDVRYHQLPKLLELKKDFAETALRELKTAQLPEHLQWAVVIAAKRLLRAVGQVQDHAKRGEIGQVALAGIDIGEAAERIVRAYFQRDVEATNKRKIGLGTGREKKILATAERRKEIAAIVKTRMQAHPRDSLTYAREIVAGEMGISFNTVRAATAGLKRPCKKMKK